MYYADSDEALLRRMSAFDDVGAFRILAERYADNAYGLAVRLLGTGAHQDAETIAQDAMLDLWNGRTVQGIGGLPVRLYRSVVARCLDKSVALTSRHKPQASGIEAVLDEMPALQRAALTLAHFDQTDLHGIVRILGLPGSEVEVLIQQGRRTLRSRLIIGQG